MARGPRTIVAHLHVLQQRHVLRSQVRGALQPGVTCDHQGMVPGLRVCVRETHAELVHVQVRVLAPVPAPPALAVRAHGSRASEIEALPIRVEPHASG